MACSQTETKKGFSSLTIAIIVIIAIVTLIGTILSLIDPRIIYTILPGDASYTLGGSVYEIIYFILTLATDALYLFGGAVIAFGAILIIFRFFERKLKDPYMPSSCTRYLSGYLTLGLEIFIGAEIIRTVIVRTPSEFALLILVIASRGLFSLILFLERKWHGTAETE